MATHLLRIDSSLFGNDGGSTRLTREFAAHWRSANPAGVVTHRDLVAQPVPHLEAESFLGFSLDAGRRTPAQEAAASLSDTLIAELRAADELVIGAPMYNFTIASQLKAWIDHVARAGETFRYTSEGPEGLLNIHRATVISTRGGRYAGKPSDSQTPYLQQVLGFLGIREVQFVYAEGMAGGSDELEAASGNLVQLAA